MSLTKKMLYAALVGGACIAGLLAGEYKTKKTHIPAMIVYADLNGDKFLDSVGFSQTMKRTIYLGTPPDNNGIIYGVKFDDFLERSKELGVPKRFLEELIKKVEKNADKIEKKILESYQ